MCVDATATKRSDLFEQKLFGAKSRSSLSICFERLIILKNQSNQTKASNKLHNFDMCIIFVPMGTKWKPIKELL